MVDPQNQFDFLERNLDFNSRKELIYALGFDNFRFNWINPTGHWRFNLADRFQRITFQQLVTINNNESEYSRTVSKHGDTSQWVSSVEVCVETYLLKLICRPVGQLEQLPQR